MIDAPSKGCAFTIDRDKRLLTFRLWGLWDEQTVSALQDGFRENGTAFRTHKPCISDDHIAFALDN